MFLKNSPRSFWPTFRKTPPPRPPPPGPPGASPPALFSTVSIVLTYPRKLRTDAFSGFRTSYFGQSMESAYWNANCESGQNRLKYFPLYPRPCQTDNSVFIGTGSWGRKKAIINQALRDEHLFTDLIRKFKRKFEELAVQLETDALALVEEHLDTIDGTLDMVRSENVALESERDPVFRARVGDEIDDLNEAMGRVLATVGNV